MKSIIKKVILFIILLVVPLLSIAQPQKPQFRPDWMYQIPNPTNSTYLYVVEHGEGNTEREALNQAIARVFQSTANRIGQFVSTDEINRAVQSGTNYDVIGRNMKVPIHKVCDFSIQNSYASKWTVYVLCQVAKAGNITPEFDYAHANSMCAAHTIYNRQVADFNRQQKTTYGKIVGMSFVPGMAQIYKGSVGKGVGFISSEVALIGGVVATECLKQNYAKKISMTHDSRLKQRYAQNANICQITRNICIGGVVAVYVWNVIDGIVANGKPYVSVDGKKTLSFMPYATIDDAGLAMSITF